MFSCCSRLADVSPLSNWTFPAANDFGLMFADCNSIVNLNGLENWDIPDGSIVHYMFQACYELKTAHLENWYVSNTMEADGMFEQCYNLQTIYCNKIWKPLTSEEMFLDCGSLSSATSDQSYQSNRVDGQMANPISGYFTHDGNVSFVRWAIYADGTLVINGNNINNYNNHGNLIYNAPENLDLYNIRSPQEIPWRDKISDISSIEFASPTSPKSMAYWFYDNKALSNFNWQNLNTSAVTNFSHVFDGCTSLTDIDLSTWNTTASQKADDIFAKCPNLKRIKVGDSFTLLKELPIGGDMNYYEGEHYYEGTMLSWTNDKMKVPQGQPGYYDSLTDGLSPNQIEGTWTPHVDESTKIEKIQYHIYDGKKLILGRQADNADYGSILSESGTIPITNVNAAEIPFQFRKTLTTVEVVSAIPTTSTAYWFYNCRNVTTITGLDKLSGPGITNAKNMFEGCNKLVQVNLPAGFGDGIVSADSKALLPEPESGEIIYNGKWSKEGTLSRNQFTPQEIQAMTGSDIAGTWYACENVNWAIYDNVHLVIGPVANDPIAAEQSGSLTQHGCIENLLTRDNVKLTVNDVPWHNFASSISTVNFTPGTAPYNMAYWFDSFVNMTSINFANLDITNVISLEHTFYNCKRIQTLDLSTWHMNRLVGNNPSGLKQTFVGCENLTTIYNQYSWKTKADVTAFGNNTKLKNSIYNISFNSTRCNSSMCNPIYGYFTFPSTQAVFTLQGVADNQIDLVMGVEKEVSITKYKCNISASSITGYDPQVVKITYDAADSTLTFTPLKAGNTTARINITTDRDVAALGNITLSIQVHKAVGSANAPTLGEFPYLLTSNNAGLIWSDKTVYSQGQTVEIPEVMNVGQSKDIAFSSDFLEVYSVLGSS